MSSSRHEGVVGREGVSAAATRHAIDLYRRLATLEGGTSDGGGTYARSDAPVLT